MQNLPRRPRRRSSFGLTLLVGILLGLGLGLLFGWVIAPVSWTPNADDVQAIADSYSLNTDLNLARTRLRGLSVEDQARIFKTLISGNNAKTHPAEAEHATALAQALRLPVDSVTARSFSLSSLMPVAVVGGVFLIGLFLLAGAIFVRGILPQLFARPSGELAGTVEEPVRRDEQKAPPPAAPPASSLGRHIATYNSGMDNFDTSFPLETSRHGFLGECGIGVSETIDDGLPDKVTAFDLWLFDKSDVRTVTQIVMSEHAYNDPDLRAKLQTKGEAVLAAKGSVLSLETQSLRIEAKIAEMAYAANPRAPAHSYFQKLIVEIASYIK